MPFQLPSSIARASRSLQRAPGFVAIATLSLGAALGLATSVFGLIDAMRHPSSPYRDVARLYEVQIYSHTTLGPSRREAEGQLAAIQGVERVATARIATADVEAGAGPESMHIGYTRPGFFELLGVRPRLGRLATPRDDAAANVAVVSDAVWRRRFQNRGQTGDAVITIGVQQYSVVGVLPKGAVLPGSNVLMIPGQVDVWTPDPAPDGSGTGVPIVRLAHGDADTARVLAQLKNIMSRFDQSYSTARDAPFAARLETLRPDPLELKDFHRAMIGASLCVLLIACANVAALMLARGVVRRRDYALRLALGAGRPEIAREVLVEVAVLAVIGCVAGAIIATWAMGLIARSTPEELHYLGFVQPQWSLRVLAVSALAVFASVAVAGGVPAWQASRTDPAGLLKDSSGGNTGRSGTRFRWLVMAELALAMTILVSASLMVKSATLMARYDFGYDARTLQSVDTWIWGRDSSSVAEQASSISDVMGRFRALPQVQSVASRMKCVTGKDVLTSDRTVEGGANAYVPGGCTAVSADFFHTLGIAVLDGRDFSEGDAAGGGAVILDQKTARLLFPHERAVGRTLKLGDMRSTEPWLPIVGVVRDQPLQFNAFPEAGADTSARVYASLPLTSSRYISWRRLEFIVRPAKGAKEVPLAITRALRNGLPAHSFFQVRAWVSDYQDSLRAEQFLSLLFSLLGIAALALGAAGLFSVVSFIANQRMREFAVRVALGATRENLLRLVMSDALGMALGGTALGAGLGMWAGFLLWDKMWGVYPVDASALAGAEITLLLVTLLACLGPAVRAGRADPVDVMRAT